MSESVTEHADCAPRYAQHALIVGIAALVLACGGGGAGAPCANHGDCDDAYQCLAQVCSPRCDRNSDCGDGYQCESSGLCKIVSSELGDSCASEWDCGLGQSCTLDIADPNGDSQLASTCQAQGEGGNVGSLCAQDEDCRNNLCTLGHCSQVCAVREDCPETSFCDSIPRILQNTDWAYFDGCLPLTSTLTTHLNLEKSGPTQNLRIPVPASAESFSIVSKVDDSSHLVGVTRVVAPNSQLLFNNPESLEDFLASPIRYARSKEVSTLTFPSDGVQPIQHGVFDVKVEASLPPFGAGTATPDISVHYKLNKSRILDLTFYFADLEDHPCEVQMGGAPITAESAQNSEVFKEQYLAEITRIFEKAGIIVEPQATYQDISPKRPDLDGITSDADLRKLFQTATNEKGIAIFLVRSLPSDGVQTLGTSIPGPPRTPGTSSSGIAVSMDSLCYRSWESLARVTAHSIAGQMGLWNNRDPDGITDPIGDSDRSTENLMYFGEFGGTELSAGQSRVLGLYPGLR